MNLQDALMITRTVRRAGTRIRRWRLAYASTDSFLLPNFRKNEFCRTPFESESPA